MTNQEIQTMVYRYHIKETSDGRIKFYKMPGMTDEDVERVKAAKPEILAFFEWKKERDERRTKTFESIPGVVELRDALIEMENYNRELNKAMERDAGVYPQPPAVGRDEIGILKRKYPEAVFALAVENGRFKTNFELADIAEKAYHALCDGRPWQEVKSEYEADMKNFVKEHMWD